MWKFRKFWKIFKYDILNFFSNVWLFRRELYGYNSFDYTQFLSMSQRSLTGLHKAIENGSEELVSRNMKLAQIQRAIDILQDMLDQNFIAKAEFELGYKYTYTFNVDRPNLKNNKDLLELASMIEENSWKELFEILKGQDLLKDIYGNERVYNGSGLRTWWI